MDVMVNLYKYLQENPPTKVYTGLNISGRIEPSKVHLYDLEPNRFTVTRIEYNWVDIKHADGYEEDINTAEGTIEDIEVNLMDITEQLQ